VAIFNLETFLGESRLHLFRLFGYSYDELPNKIIVQVLKGSVNNGEFSSNPWITFMTEPTVVLDLYICICFLRTETQCCGNGDHLH